MESSEHTRFIRTVALTARLTELEPLELFETLLSVPYEDVALYSAETAARMGTPMPFPAANHEREVALNRAGKHITQQGEVPADTALSLTMRALRARYRENAIPQEFLTHRLGTTEARVHPDGFQRIFFERMRPQLAATRLDMASAQGLAIMEGLDLGDKYGPWSQAYSDARRIGEALHEVETQVTTNTLSRVVIDFWTLSILDAVMDTSNGLVSRLKLLDDENVPALDSDVFDPQTRNDILACAPRWLVKSLTRAWNNDD